MGLLGSICSVLMTDWRRCILFKILLSRTLFTHHSFDSQLCFLNQGKPLVSTGVSPPPCAVVWKLCPDSKLVTLQGSPHSSPLSEGLLPVLPQLFDTNCLRIIVSYTDNPRRTVVQLVIFLLHDGTKVVCVW